VCGFTEPDPDGGGVRLVASTSRRCKAIWNILTQAGLRSHVVGWYASHPCEPINGVMVSNHFEQLIHADGKLAPPPPQSVHPSDRLAELAEFRVSPHEIDASAVLPFIPNAETDIKRPGSRVAALRRLVAQSATVHATATHLLAKDDWDFAAVYYEGIDRFGHEFMEFHPPKMDQVSQEDFDAYRECMRGAYRFHDMMLQSLLETVGEETTVVLISDHGYYSDHLRPDPHEENVSPAVWHRPFGVFAAQGPGFEQSGRLYGANLLDITPTLLQLLGLPASADMPGRVLSEILTNADPIERIMSWEDLPGECGMHDAGARVDPVEARESLRQLVDLGYIDAPSDDDEKAARDASFWNTINLAQSLFYSGRLKKALETIETLDEVQSNSMPVRLMRAACLLGMNERVAARKSLEELRADVPDHPRVAFMLGALEQSEGNEDAALREFERVRELSPRLPGLHNKLGSLHLSAKRYEQALEAYNTAIAIDGDSPVAYLGRARVYLEQGKPESSLDEALHAVELTHFLPAGHFVIAKSLLRLGRAEDAVKALCLCITQAPQMPGAYELLQQVYRELGRHDEAVEVALKAAAAPIPKPVEEKP
jgi:tetratricopeptide (TPR) repeat protein